MSPLNIGGGSELEVNGGVRISFTVVAIVRFRSLLWFVLGKEYLLLITYLVQNCDYIQANVFAFYL